MVSSGALKGDNYSYQPETKIELPEEELRWCSVRLNEVLSRTLRFEASVFDVEGKHARKVLEMCKFPNTAISGEWGLSNAYHRPRFKRIWIDKPGIPIFQPSQISEINPKPSGYLSYLTQTDIDALRVHKDQILLTCSGTIGQVSLVQETLNNQVFSHDLIRISCKKPDTVGYLYAFLKTKVGNALIRTNEYGAVISHIEPEHLDSVPIPIPPPELIKKIHDLVIRSFALRDESNILLDEAEKLLCDALKLPLFEKIFPDYFDRNADLNNYTVNLSDLDQRFDASYHNPTVAAILHSLWKEAKEVTTIGDPRISKRLILPNRFTRVYVKEGQGAIYFTGKNILELDPSDKKYLSFAQHEKKIRDELTIRHNMLLVTCSGTLGNVVLCPRHWNSWVMTHDIIRIEPANIDLIGFIWVFLASNYGQILIKRHSYGAVVQHIESHHLDRVVIPLLKDKKIQNEINSLALEANEKRSEAYNLEQEAIRITNEEVIYAT